MKILADMGVSQTVVKSLRDMNYDAKHLREEGLQCLPDPLIIEKAKLEDRIILTFDLDFGDLMAASKAELPSVIIFRLKNTSPQFVFSRLLNILENCSEDLSLTIGAVVIVSDERYRVRHLPIY
jgi:predicted nuclease of predicted toxin-antitoxin system